MENAKWEEIEAALAKPASPSAPLFPPEGTRWEKVWDKITDVTWRIGKAWNKFTYSPYRKVRYYSGFSFGSGGPRFYYGQSTSGPAAPIWVFLNLVMIFTILGFFAALMWVNPHTLHRYYIWFITTFRIDHYFFL